MVSILIVLLFTTALVGRSASAEGDSPQEGDVAPNKDDFPDIHEMAMLQEHEFCSTYMECRQSNFRQFESCAGGAVHRVLAQRLHDADDGEKKNEEGAKGERKTHWAKCSEEMNEKFEPAIKNVYNHMHNFTLDCMGMGSSTDSKKRQAAAEVKESMESGLHVICATMWESARPRGWHLGGVLAPRECKLVFEEEMRRCDHFKVCCPKFADCRRRLEDESELVKKEKQVAKLHRRCMEELKDNNSDSEADAEEHEEEEDEEEDTEGTSKSGAQEAEAKRGAVQTKKAEKASEAKAIEGGLRRKAEAAKGTTSKTSIPSSKNASSQAYSDIIEFGELDSNATLSLAAKQIARRIRERGNAHPAACNFTKATTPHERLAMAQECAQRNWEQRKEAASKLSKAYRERGAARRHGAHGHNASHVEHSKEAEKKKEAHSDNATQTKKEPSRRENNSTKTGWVERFNELEEAIVPDPNLCNVSGKFHGKEALRMAHACSQSIAKQIRGAWEKATREWYTKSKVASTNTYQGTNHTASKPANPAATPTRESPAQPTMHAPSGIHNATDDEAKGFLAPQEWVRRTVEFIRQNKERQWEASIAFAEWQKALYARPKPNRTLHEQASSKEQQRTKRDTATSNQAAITNNDAKMRTDPTDPITLWAEREITQSLILHDGVFDDEATAANCNLTLGQKPDKKDKRARECAQQVWEHMDAAYRGNSNVTAPSSMTMRVPDEKRVLDALKKNTATGVIRGLTLGMIRYGGKVVIANSPICNLTKAANNGERVAIARECVRLIWEQSEAAYWEGGNVRDQLIERVRATTDNVSTQMAVRLLTRAILKYGDNDVLANSTICNLPKTIAKKERGKIAHACAQRLWEENEVAHRANLNSTAVSNQGAQSSSPNNAGAAVVQKAGQRDNADPVLALLGGESPAEKSGSSAGLVAADVASPANNTATANLWEVVSHADSINTTDPSVRRMMGEWKNSILKARKSREEAFRKRLSEWYVRARVRQIMIQLLQGERDRQAASQAVAHSIEAKLDNSTNQAIEKGVISNQQASSNLTLDVPTPTNATEVNARGFARTWGRGQLATNNQRQPFMEWHLGKQGKTEGDRKLKFKEIKLLNQKLGQNTNIDEKQNTPPNTASGTDAKSAKD